MSVARAHDMAQQSADPSIRLAGEHSMQADLRRALVAVALIAPAPSAFADVIADWNEKVVAFVTPRMTPPAAQRVVAMVQVAMFDAVNSIERRYRPYLVQLPAPTAASKEAAAAAAAGSCWLACIRRRRPNSRLPRLPIYPTFPTATRSRKELDSARWWRGKFWRRAPRTAPMPPTPTARRPSPASMCRRRSRSPPCGRT